MSSVVRTLGVLSTLAFVGLASLAAASPAEAVVFCEKKGKVKVRAEACKGKESLLFRFDPAALGARMDSVEEEVAIVKDDVSSATRTEVFSFRSDESVRTGFAPVPLDGSAPAATFRTEGLAQLVVSFSATCSTPSLAAGFIGLRIDGDQVEYTPDFCDQETGHGRRTAVFSIDDVPAGEHSIEVWAGVDHWEPVTLSRASLTVMAVQN